MTSPLWALRAEWTKLRTTRGTAWLPSLAAILTIGGGAAVSAVAAPGTTACASGCDPVTLSLSGVHLGQLAVVVLAVLTVTSEYQTGLIAVTLAATPRRLSVYAAKVATVTAAVVPAAVLGVAGALLAGRLLLPGNGFPMALARQTVLRAAAGTVLYLFLLALLALGLATALRHTAPALSAVLALLYLWPLLGRLVAVEPWHAWLDRYAPANADPAALAGYAAAALLAGGAFFTARDG
ncbi:ABC transporter permease [Micromonospora sp. CPCC 206061]|uniref:ABC transporter permease n=1 Tax=Micromonospora sp. CPCC 206061 TaxID=3122410 RepID=UPI002FF198A6